MVAKELLDLLVCPETRQGLELADGAFLSKLNERIAAGTVRTGAGKKVETPVEAGLVREDKQVLYPIEDDIPIMILDDRILLAS